MTLQDFANEYFIWLSIGGIIFCMSLSAWLAYKTAMWETERKYNRETAQVKTHPRRGAVVLSKSHLQSRVFQRDI